MRPSPKSGGAPGWIVTFADLMSLLLTFFILLLSFSEIDAGRYREISNAMQSAFSVEQVHTYLNLLGIEREMPRARVLQDLSLPPAEREEATPEPPPEQAEAPPAEPAPPPADRALAELKSALDRELARGLVEVGMIEGDVVIRLPERASFPPGSATMSAQMSPILDKVVPVIAALSGRIVVTGHTDDVPIATDRFRSNWDLSSARAVSVVHYLTRQIQIAENRLVVQGLADTRPLVPNDTPANRARNRRVEIVVEP